MDLYWTGHQYNLCLFLVACLPLVKECLSPPLPPITDRIGPCSTSQAWDCQTYQIFSAYNKIVAVYCSSLTMDRLSKFTTRFNIFSLQYENLTELVIDMQLYRKKCAMLLAKKCLWFFFQYLFYLLLQALYYCIMGIISDSSLWFKTNTRHIFMLFIYL